MVKEANTHKVAGRRKRRQREVVVKAKASGTTWPQGEFYLELVLL